MHLSNYQSWEMLKQKFEATQNETTLIIFLRQELDNDA